MNNLSWRFWSFKQQSIKKPNYASSTLSQNSKFYLDEEETTDEEDEVLEIPKIAINKKKPVSLLTIMFEQEHEYEPTSLHRCERYEHLDELFSIIK